MSDQRQTFSVEAGTGRYITPQRVRCRYIEVEPISGAGLYVRWSGPLPPAAQVGQVAQYDGTVPVNARTVFDTGTEDNYLVAVEDMSGSGFGARIRTDIEPILTTHIDRTFAGTQVTPLPGTPAFPVDTPVATRPWATLADQAVTSSPALMVLASSVTRRGLLVRNVGANNARLGFGLTPTATTGQQVRPGEQLIATAPDVSPDQVNAIAETGSTSLAVVSW